MTTLIISNKEINNVMKIVKCLKVSGLLVEGISKTIENKAKEQRDGFSSISLVHQVLVY